MNGAISIFIIELSLHVIRAYSVLQRIYVIDACFDEIRAIHIL